MRCNKMFPRHFQMFPDQSLRPSDWSWNIWLRPSETNRCVKKPSSHTFWTSRQLYGTLPRQCLTMLTLRFTLLWYLRVQEYCDTLANCQIYLRLFINCQVHHIAKVIMIVISVIGAHGTKCFNRLLARTVLVISFFLMLHSNWFYNTKRWYTYIDKTFIL